MFWISLQIIPADMGSHQPLRNLKIYFIKNLKGESRNISKYLKKNDSFPEVMDIEVSDSETILDFRLL